VERPRPFLPTPLCPIPLSHSQHQPSQRYRSVKLCFP
jgi:hypothetical protein